MNERFIYKDVDVILNKTSKFKSIVIDTTFEGEFNSSSIAQKNLLHLVLENNNKFVKTKEEVINKAFDLYNAVVDVNISVNHQILSTSFTLDIIDYDLINKGEVLFEALEYYRNFIFSPDVENDSFQNDVFLEKKKAIKDSIVKRYNNKGAYAVRKLLEQMCPGELLEIPVTGTIEELEKITPTSLYKTYLDMIENESLVISITGNVTKEKAEKIIDTILGDYAYIKKECNLSPFDTTYHEVKEIKHLSEKQEINQSRLVMGFRTNINHQSPLARPLQLFNLMFGGMYSSNLFQKVREELSLAYSIYSDAYIGNQLFMVSAGVNSCDAQKVEEIVLEELVKYQNGDFNLELLDEAKQFVISDIERMDDSNYSINNYYYRQRLLGLDNSPSQLRNKYLSVTKEDIIEASKMIVLDSVFTLIGDSNE